MSNIDISLSYKYQPNINSNSSMRNGNSLSLNDLSTNRNDISNYSQSYTYQLENNRKIIYEVNLGSLNKLIYQKYYSFENL